MASASTTNTTAPITQRNHGDRLQIHSRTRGHSPGAKATSASSMPMVVFLCGFIGFTFSRHRLLRLGWFNNAKGVAVFHLRNGRGHFANGVTYVCQFFQPKQAIGIAGVDALKEYLKVFFVHVFAVNRTRRLSVQKPALRR